MIKPKMNVGDTGYAIVLRRVETNQRQCELCEGKKKITIKDKEYSCVECNGTGHVMDVINKHVPKEMRVDSIQINITKDRVHTVYKQLAETYRSADSERFFTTYAEALEQASKDNAQARKANRYKRTQSYYPLRSENGGENYEVVESAGTPMEI